jgi:hypothetical protein
MINLFDKFLGSLGSPKDQKSETVALVVIYSMTLSFTLVMIALVIMVIGQLNPEVRPSRNGELQAKSNLHQF